MSAVIVIGSGFAGLWAALGAARRLDELQVGAGTVDITVLSAQPFHDIRVRNYEADLSACRIPLADVLDPAGIAHIATEVTTIDSDGRIVTTSGGVTYGYDRLVLASGSRVVKPGVAGLREFGFDVDTYDGAVALQRHLRALADDRPSPAATTVVVVGAGLTGVETACELPDRLRTLFVGRTPRVVLVDHSGVGSDMGASARPIIEEALSDNGIETRTGVSVAAISDSEVVVVLRRTARGRHFGVVCGHAGQLVDRAAAGGPRPVRSGARRRLSAGGRDFRRCSPRVTWRLPAWTGSICR